MAQENLLQNLYAYATNLSPIELESMLSEDVELKQKRAAAQAAAKARRRPELWRRVLTS